MIYFIEEIIDALGYAFILRALIVGSLVALCSACLGVFIVLKKHAMIGDGLAHVSFATIALAILLGMTPLIVSIPLVVLASFLIRYLNDKAEIHGDAAIGLVSSTAIAIGVMITSLSKGFDVDLYNYLFGSILTTQPIDVFLSILLSVFVLTTIILFYNTFFAITYDEEFAKVNGIKTKFANYLLSILTSITIVLGIRVVGTLLISSMIIFPTVSALQLSRGFKQTIFISCIISVLSIFVGIFSSYFIDTPPGATTVLFNGLVFLLFYSLKLVTMK